MNDLDWCERRNFELRQKGREDIEWAVGPSGIYLRHRDAFTAANTRESERRREEERQRWLHNHRNPA